VEIEIRRNEEVYSSNYIFISIHRTGSKNKLIQ